MPVSLLRLASSFVVPMLAMLPLLAGCGSQTTGTPDGTPDPKPTTEPVAETGPILVGEYGSMTGSEATFGQSTHNGVTLAIEEINAAGGINGRPLEVKVYDTQGKTQEAGTAVTRLITDDKAVAIIGEVASSLSMAGGRVAQQYGVPMITPSSTNAQVTRIGDMVSRVCFIDGFQGYVVAKFAMDDLKADDIAILYDQGQAYSKGLKDDFSRELVSMGGRIATEQAYTGGDQDFSAQLTAIRDTKPDAIFVPGYYTDVGNLAIQARKLGITAPLLGGDGWDSSQLATLAGDAIEGSYYSNHYSHEDTRPAVQTFVTTFQTRFGTVPDGLAAMGYDATKLLADAMRRSPSLSGKDLAAAINSTKDFPGVTGTITIDAERNAHKPAVIVQMKGGQPRYVTTIYPKGSEPAAPTEGTATP